MDVQGFQRFLKRGGRSPSAQKRCVAYLQDFQRFLEEQRGGCGLDEAGPDDLKAFVAWVERGPKSSAKGVLWGMRYYYEYTSNDEMGRLASALRQQRIARKPFLLREFRGVNAEYVAKLAAAGIRDVEEILEAGRTPGSRQELADKTGVPADAVLEFVKLSDLARLGGVKGIRARLYYDAGVDTLAKMAQWEPEALRTMLVAFVERTGFDGIAPLPKEARNAVETAKRLSKIVQTEE